MRSTIDVAVIGTGWCGGIRAQTCAKNPFVRDLHIAEIKPERLKEVADLTQPASATADYRTLLDNRSIDAVIISTTPEPTHYPIAKESLLAGKHVFLEKPIALELAEADELIALARSKNLLFTIGYSQRFNPKFAYVKRSIDDGTIGQPVSALVSRHITRNLGKKIGGRVKLSPAAMEATHDIDFVLWCLAPREARPRLRPGSSQDHEAISTTYRTASGSSSPWTTARRLRSAPAGCCRRRIRISQAAGSRWSAPKAPSWSTIRIATST